MNTAKTLELIETYVGLSSVKLLTTERKYNIVGGCNSTIIDPCQNFLALQTFFSSDRKVEIKPSRPR